jgi:hypothetical protein
VPVAATPAIGVSDRRRPYSIRSKQIRHDPSRMSLLIQRAYRKLGYQKKHQNKNKENGISYSQAQDRKLKLPDINVKEINQ